MNNIGYILRPNPILNATNKDLRTRINRRIKPVIRGTIRNRANDLYKNTLGPIIKRLRQPLIGLTSARQWARIEIR